MPVIDAYHCSRDRIPSPVLIFQPGRAPSTCGRGELVGQEAHTNLSGINQLWRGEQQIDGPEAACDMEQNLLVQAVVVVSPSLLVSTRP